MQVIIADENIIHRKKIRQIVESIGYQVIDEAKNGLHTYHKYIERNPDLLIMNINMPLYDGISTLDRIMSFDPGAKIVVIAHHHQNQLLFEAMEKGAIHYLKFPLEADKIRKIFREVEVLERRSTDV